MADANSVDANERGVTVNGDAEPWRLVAVRHSRNIGDIVNDPARQEWNSAHNGKSYQGTFDAFEQIVGVAEQVAWKHKFSNGKTYDFGDVIIALGEFLVKQGLL